LILLFFLIIRGEKNCGNPSCACQKGKLHGPYPYLSEKRKGKTHLTYIKKGDLEKVERKTEQ